jgi:hypothetical protein
MAVLLFVVVATVALSGECGSRAARAAASGEAAPATRIAFVIDDRVKLSAPLLNAALDEAAAIWAPYGVRIEQKSTALSECDGEDVAEVLITIVPAANAALMPDGAGARGNETPLGLTAFDEDGQPIPSIVIFHTSILRVAARVVRLGVPMPRWPSSLKDEVVARLIGRTLAHELGHFVLRLQAHSTFGLMRAFHRLEELADGGRSAFRLGPIDVARLRDSRATLAMQPQ